jgi:hypothetical protein
MSRFAIVPNNSPTLWEGGEPLTSGCAGEAVFDGRSSPPVSFSVKNLGFFHLSHTSHFSGALRSRIAMFPCVSSGLERAVGTYGNLHRCGILIHFASSPPSCTLHVGQIVASAGYSHERESNTFCTNTDPRPSAGSGQALRGRDAGKDEFHLYGRSEGLYTGRMAEMHIRRNRPTCAKRSLPRSLLFPKYFGARD